MLMRLRFALGLSLGVVALAIAVTVYLGLEIDRARRIAVQGTDLLADVAGLPVLVEEYLNRDRVRAVAQWRARMASIRVKAAAFDAQTRATQIELIIRVLDTAFAEVVDSRLPMPESAAGTQASKDAARLRFVRERSLAQIRVNIFKLVDRAESVVHEAHTRLEWMVIAGGGAIIALLSAGGLAGLIGLYFASRRTLVRVEAIRQGALAIAAGNLAVPLADQRPDELGEMARALDRMAQRLGELIRAGREHVARLERETAERARSEARFRALTELSADWYWEQDAELRYTMFSDSTRKLAHMDYEKLIGLRRWEIPGTNPLAGSWDDHRALLLARRPYRDAEFSTYTDDGQAMIYSVSGQPLIDEAGAFAGYRGVSYDITERKRAEQLLRLQFGVSRELAGAAEPSRALREIMRIVCEAIRSDCGRFYAVDETAGILQMQVAWTVDGDRETAKFVDAIRAFALRRGEGLAGAVWESAEPMWVEDPHSDPRSLRPFAGSDYGMRSLFLLPVSGAPGVIGVLLFSSRHPLLRGEQQDNALRAIAGQIGQFLERRRAEEMQLRLRAAMDASGDLLLLIDPKAMRYVDFNEAACRMLGYTREELLGLDITAVVMEGREELRRGYYSILANPATVEGLSGRFRRKDGSAFPFESTRRLLDTPHGPLIVAIARDITDRLAAENRLRESEARYRLLFDFNPLPLYVVDLETMKILDANERMAQQYGWSREELGGMSMLDLRPPQEREAAMAFVHSGLGRNERIARRHWRRNGEIFDVEVTVFDMSVNGRPARLVAPIDMSEREHTERSLREAADSLRLLSRRLVSVQEDQRRELARELHDRVGQNLTALAINLEILRGGALAPAEREQRLRDSAELTETTAKMIDDVTVELRPPMLDAYGLAAALRWYGEQQATRTGVAIKVRADAGGTPAARPERDLALFRIVQEAFNNVLQHADARRVEIALQEGAQGLELTVRDDGRGLDAEAEVRSRTRHGLRGMRERAMAIGASFEVLPAPGGGTLVRVQVPA